MSIDRCSRCSDLVDTDNEPEAYVQIADMRTREEWICLCAGCRERHEDEMGEPTDREFSPAQQAIIAAHEAAADPDFDPSDAELEAAGAGGIK